MHRFILSDVRLTILELGNALSLHHNVDQVAVIAAAGEQILASFGINIFTDFGNIGPSCTGHVIDSLTDLLQQIGAVCKDNSAVIHRHTVVNTVHDGVGQLFLSETIPVNIGTFHRNEGVRIIGNITLDVVILELHDVGQIGIIVCRTCQRDGIFYITCTGLLDHFQFKLRVNIFLVVCGSSVQSRNIEILIPCVGSQLVTTGLRTANTCTAGSSSGRTRAATASGQGCSCTCSSHNGQKCATRDLFHNAFSFIHETLKNLMNPRNLEKESNAFTS